MTAQPNPLASVLGPGGAVLTPEAAMHVLRAISTAEVVYRRNGVALPAALVELQVTLTKAVNMAHSFARFADESTNLGFTPDLTSSVMGTSISSSTSVLDPIDVREAADLLRCSEQWIRSRCRRGEFASARQSGRVWTLDRSELVSLARQEAA